MRIRRFFVAFCIVLLIVDFVTYAPNDLFNNHIVKADEKSAEGISENDLHAKSAILIDADSKRALYDKNGYEQMPMASTTKIMTCLVALENSTPDMVVTFSGYASSKPKVKLGAAKGSQFYMKDMLFSLMLESHNDTAVAIAEAVAGSEENFALMMNDRAKSVGAFETNFVTANGLDAVNHYTTAYDLALITAEALKNEEFIRIIGTPSHSFSEITGKGNYGVTNKDAFLSMMEGAIGVKTGFTGKAGYCFVGALKRNNKTFISVVLGSGWPPQKNYKWKDTIKLMNYGLNNFEYKLLFSPIDEYKTLQVEGGIEKEVDTYINGSIGTLISENDNVEYEYEVTKHLKAPISKNQVLGKVIIKINSEKYTSFNICAKEKVEIRDFNYCLKKVIEILLI